MFYILFLSYSDPPGLVQSYSNKMPRTPCPGCKAQFSSRALALHLAQSEDPRCRAAYEQQDDYLPGNELYSNSESPNTFNGDVFGNDYTEEDFPGPWPDSDDDLSDSRSHHSSSPSSDEGSSDEGPGEGGAALAPGMDLHTAEGGEEEDEDMDMDGDERGRLLTSEERRKVESCQWAEPVVVEYPSPRAGESLTSESAASYGYKGYARELEAEKADNPYLPFASKLDWEFAKWAKLRGPGSTATTELLNIEGVRF